MSRKPRKPRKPASTRGIDNELLDQLMDGSTDAEELFGQGGLFQQLRAALLQRAMDAEMTEHLGYPKHDPAGNNSGNSRNGSYHKTLKTDEGPLTIDVPRDRSGSFEPQIVPKGSTHFRGFDDKILALYARGMTVRDIQSQLEEMYSVPVAPSLISRVTDAIWEELVEWRARPLDSVYPIVYIDALFIKVRTDGQVVKRAVYSALAIDEEGRKQVLGLWMGEQEEGARYWLGVMTELKNRGVEDMLIVCCDGLSGLPGAIEAVFPYAIVQSCIVHQIRNSLKQVQWKQRREVARDLKAIYNAPTEQVALSELDAFGAKWDAQYPLIARSWRNRWELLRPFLDFPPEIRHAIYTTNAIESLNSQLRKAVRNRGHFPTEKSAYKVLYLCLSRVEKKWRAPMKTWVRVRQQLLILFPDRMPL